MITQNIGTRFEGAGGLSAQDYHSITGPRAFRDQIMEPDYATFAQNPHDLRLAFHAALSLFHLRDWVAVASGQRPGVVQEDLQARCKSFKVVTDVANAAKHLGLKPDRRKTDMTGAGDVQLQKIAVVRSGDGGIGIIVYPDGLSFDTVAAEVHKMWTQFFEDNGL